MRYVRRYILFFALFAFALRPTYAQKNYDYNWVLLNFNHIDFNTDPPTVSAMMPEPYVSNTGSYSTSISDKDGVYLFSSGGCKVLDATHQLLANGDSINNDFVFQSWCGSGTFPGGQNITIFPKPHSNTQYYIINTDMEDHVEEAVLYPAKRLFYHIIDMAAENGKGAVIEKRQIALQDTMVVGGIQACHNNNFDKWWVISPKWNTNCYFVIPFADKGPDTPQKFCVGDTLFHSSSSSDQVVFSPDGSYYARIIGDSTAQVFDFDTQTGTLSNARALVFPIEQGYYHGGAFSPNSRFLYISSGRDIFQVDMEANDLQASMVHIYRLPEEDFVSQVKGLFGQQQLAPNGKIYIASPTNHMFLSTINRPNCKGVLCDFQPHSLELVYSNFAGLPNLPHFGILDIETDCDSIPTSTTSVREEVRVRLFPNPVSDILHIEVAQESTEEVLIYTLAGERVQSHNLQTRKGQISVEKLPDGMYILEIHLTSGQRFCKKIIVARQ